MSSIDQAFIKAYRASRAGSGSTEEAAAGSPRPNAPLPGPHFATGRPAPNLLRRRLESDAVFVLDHVDWSSAAIDLSETQGDRLLWLLQDLARIRGALGLASAKRGVGGTTLALALGRVASQSGLRAALVDGGDGQLLEGLGVVRAPEMSPERTLAECTIHSRADGISAFLAAPQLDRDWFSATLTTIAERHDLVLCDLGAVGIASPMGSACSAIVVVADASAQDPRLAAEVEAAWPGTPVLGVVDRPAA